MKISLGMNLQSGPWGGGNQFGHSLVYYLKERGVEVCFDLEQPDLDLIVLVEPRSKLQISAYTDKEIKAYLLQKRWQTLVVHRINECDERKGTTYVNQQLIKANACADHTVFISSWLRDLFSYHGLQTPTPNVILNGANKHIFNAYGYVRWDKMSKLRLVTHHWGGGYLKGFDIYKRIDELLATSPFKERLEFTYIGKLPEDIEFTNARYIPPKSGMELADAIRQHHVYLTASQNEPAGMHHIEGAMCGLPLLYRESGALSEYCQGFGIGFTADNFKQKLQEMLETYDVWVGRMKEYPHTAEHMCENYYHLFLDLLEHRDEILQRRKWWRKPVWFAERTYVQGTEKLSRLGDRVHRLIKRIRKKYG
jgi:glycosyltransferase involved in cell wall biosynthesis